MTSSSVLNSVLVRLAVGAIVLVVPEVAASADPAAPDTLGCPITTLISDDRDAAVEVAPNLGNRYGRAVYLVLQSEFAAAGITPGTQLSGIGWRFTTAPGISGDNNPLIVYLQNTADTTNTKSTTWTTAIAGMTVVHNAVTNIPNVVGPWDILFSGGAFTYTGGGLYVAFDSQYPVGTLTGVVRVAVHHALQHANLVAYGSAPPTTLQFADFNRPETRFRPTIAPVLNDVSVEHVISYGALPRDLAEPQAVQAVVLNRGGNAQTNLPVTLTVSGANSFTDTRSVPTLAACNGRATVTFTPYSASNQGSDTLTATVPADEVPANSSKAVTVDVTGREFSFKYPGTTAAGGLGFDEAQGALVGEFTTTYATTVVAVSLDFNTSSSFAKYRVAIYADSGTSKPGALLYLDPSSYTVNASGGRIIGIPPTPVVAGNFYAGIHQMSLTNARLSYDNETPVRGGKFFLASPLPPAEWTELAPLNNFKLNVGVVLNPCAPPLPAHVCDDGSVCTVDTCSSVNGCTHSPGPNGTACNDGNGCTIDDACSSGVCAGVPSGPTTEAQNVNAADDKTTFDWEAVPGATRYGVVRGLGSAFPVGPGGGDEVCFNDLAATTINDPAVPVSGAVFWYLTRGENSCGNGPYGNQGLVGGAPGAPRSTTTCP